MTTLDKPVWFYWRWPATVMWATFFVSIAASQFAHSLHGVCK